MFVLMSANGARHEDGGTRTLIGGMLAGWGLFNTVEGLVDHHVLNLHHVRPGPDELLYDLGFLIWGLIMLMVGIAILATSKRPASGS